MTRTAKKQIGWPGSLLVRCAQRVTKHARLTKPCLEFLKASSIALSVLTFLKVGFDFGFGFHQGIMFCDGVVSVGVCVAVYADGEMMPVKIIPSSLYTSSAI